MTITITPDSTDIGAMCTAHLQYPGAVPPVPNDVHIDAKHDDGTWHAVTGHETIPAGFNPVAGFDIRFSGGSPNVGGPGRRRFRVRWTLDGKPLGTAEETTATLGPAPPPAPPPPPVDISDKILEILKYLFVPITLPWCLICRAVGAGNPSCRIACALVPHRIKKALGLL